MHLRIATAHAPPLGRTSELGERAEVIDAFSPACRRSVLQLEQKFISSPRCAGSAREGARIAFLVAATCSRVRFPPMGCRLRLLATWVRGAHRHPVVEHSPGVPFTLVRSVNGERQDDANDLDASGRRTGCLSGRRGGGAGQHRRLMAPGRGPGIEACPAAWPSCRSPAIAARCSSPIRRPSVKSPGRWSSSW